MKSSIKDHTRFPWKVGSLLRGLDKNPYKETDFPQGGLHFLVMEIVNQGEPACCRLLQVYTQKEKNEAFAPPYEGWIEDSVVREWELERLA